MKASTLIAALVVGLFVLTLVSFFASVLAFLHGPLLGGAGPAFAGIAYSILGITGAGALALGIPADAIAERRVPDPGDAANLTRGVRAACAWAVGMVGMAMLALVAEWPMLGASVVALGAMALQFPGRRKEPGS